MIAQENKKDSWRSSLLLLGVGVLLALVIGRPLWLKKVPHGQVGLEGFVLDISAATVDEAGAKIRELKLQQNDNTVSVVHICDGNCGDNGESRYNDPDIAKGSRVRIMANRIGNNIFHGVDFERLGQVTKAGRIAEFGGQDIRTSGHVIQKLILEEDVNNNLSRSVPLAACLDRCPHNLGKVDLSGLASKARVAVSGAFDQSGIFQIESLIPLPPEVVELAAGT